LSDFAPAGEADRLRHVAAGDDYELLFAAPPARRDAIEAAAGLAKTRVSRIGCLQPALPDAALADRVRLIGAGGEALLPPRLGYEHR
jgi:thiamine-monophosphate kinase